MMVARRLVVKQLIDNSPLLAMMVVSLVCVVLLAAHFVLDRIHCVLVLAVLVLMMFRLVLARVALVVLVGDWLLFVANRAALASSWMLLAIDNQIGAWALASGHHLDSVLALELVQDCWWLVR